MARLVLLVLIFLCYHFPFGVVGRTWDLIELLFDCCLFTLHNKAAPAGIYFIDDLSHQMHRCLNIP